MESQITEKVSLAELMNRGRITDLNAVKEFLAKYGDELGIDFPDRNGLTSLMVACKEGWEDIVKFLLESGANPNSKCILEDNTPLHYLCEGDKPTVDACRRQQNYPTENFQTRIRIARQLLSQGARIELNDGGLSAPCLAALHSFTDVVEFFVSDGSGINMSPEEKVTAFELLGMSQAILDRHHLSDAQESFAKAESFQHSKETSPKEIHPSFPKSFRNSECFTQSTSEGVTREQVRQKAFLIAERNLPEEYKEEYLWCHLAEFASDTIIKPDTAEEGFQTFLYLIEQEMESKIELGTVLGQMKELCSPAFSSESGLRVLFHIDELGKKYLQGLTTLDKTLVRENGSELLETLGRLIFNVVYYYPAKCHLESVLESVEGMANLILQSFDTDLEDDTLYSCETCITQVFFDAMLEAMWQDVYCGQSKETRNRVQLAMGRLLWIDSDLDVDTLPSLMELDYIVGDLDFTVSLTRSFLRYNCPSPADTDLLQSAKEIFLEKNDIDDEQEELEYAEILSLLSPPTSPLSLEELAVRAVIHHRVPYRRSLPVTLLQTIEGKTFKDSELNTGIEDSEESD